MKQRVAIQGDWSVIKMRLKEPNDLYRFLAKFKMLSRGLAVWAQQPARQTGAWDQLELGCEPNPMGMNLWHWQGMPQLNLTGPCVSHGFERSHRVGIGLRAPGSPWGGAGLIEPLRELGSISVFPNSTLKFS